MTKVDAQFRQAFSRMAPQAIITRDELATLLATSAGAISQMAYRGELPTTAFPGKRRACWFVKDIRSWLDRMAAEREADESIINTPKTAQNATRTRKTGRPRNTPSDINGGPL